MRRDPPYGGSTNQPTGATGPNDPRHRIRDQVDASGVNDDPDVFRGDKTGRRTLRLNPRGALRADKNGLDVATSRYLGRLPDGTLTLDIPALLSEVFRVRPDARVELQLGSGLELSPSGALRVKRALGVANLTDSTAGVVDGTLEAVPSGSLATLAAAAANNFAELNATVNAIKTALKAAGIGVGV